MRKLGKFLAVFSLLFVSFVIATQNGYAQTSNTWLDVGQMTQPRTGAAAVLLSDGKVLITGGSDSNGVPQASTETFDPVTGQFSTTAPMNAPRANHAAITLDTGDVLVTGGLTTGGGYSDSAEIFNAQTGTWTTLEASLGSGLAKHAMASLFDGNVLIIGGESTTGAVLNLLLFKPSDQSINPIGTLTTARMDAAAAATPDGRVLIAGGVDINGAVLNSTEIFTYSPDTMAGTVAAGPNMTYPRANATATKTYDGVAVIGGSNGTVDLGTAEIFSQWTSAFRVVNGATPRSGHIAALLPKNGSILAMGGTGGTAVDLLQPWANNRTGAFNTGGPSNLDRTGGFAAPGSLGTLLGAGGAGSSANAAELYLFPTISTDQPDYAPGTPVVMSGTGFKPGEAVDLHLHEWVNQTVTDPPDYAVGTDAAGSFTFTGYVPTTSDLGARYHLTAIGETSGLQAQTIFTDAVQTSTAIVSGTNPSSSGANVTFTAAVTFCNGGSGQTCSGGTITPVTVGTVTFKTGTNTNCTGAGSATLATGVSLNGSGQATQIASFTNPPSSINVCAIYSGFGSGNSAFAVSNGFVTQTVNATVSTTTGVSSPTVTYGQTATSTVTVTSTSSPTGSVSMNVTGGGSASCTALAAATSTTSTSTCTINYSAGGVASSPYSLSATYTPSGAFTGSSGTGSLTVGPLAITLTAGNYSGTYDGNTHALSACASSAPAFVTCTNSPVGPVGPDATTSAQTVIATPNYVQGTAADYSITANNGSWSIAPLAVTLNAGSYSGVYDGNPHSLSACSSSAATFVTCTNNPAGPVGPDVGGASVTPTPVYGSAIASDFTITSNNGSWSITPLAVTLSAGSYSGVYDGNSHALSACTSSAPTLITCTNNPAASVGPDVGGASVSPTPVYGSGNAADYTITSTNGSWSITPLAVTLHAGSYSGTYDASTHTLSACTSSNASFVTCTNNPAGAVGPGVGSGSVTPNPNYVQGISGDYNLTSDNGSWSITSAPLTATLIAHDKTYDGTMTEPDANMSCTLAGVFPADIGNVSCVASSGTFSTTHVGTWTVTATATIGGSAGGNYTLGTAGTTLSSTSETASASITPLALTTTAGSYSGTFDGNTHPLTDCSSSAPAFVTCTNSPVGPVGPHATESAQTVTPTPNYVQGDAGDYMITANNGSWSIAPRAVTITAGSYSGTFDGNMHPLSDCSSSASTFVTCANNPLGPVGPHATTSALTVTPIPNYVQGNAGDYNLSTNNGSWSIAQLPVTITAGSYSAPYDGVSHALSACTSSAAGFVTCTNNPAGPEKNAGSGTVTPTPNYAQGIPGDYNLTSISGAWNITAVPLTVTSDNKSMILHGTLPTFTATYSGFVGGEGPGSLTGTLNCSAGTNGQNVGIFTINCSGQSSTNYIISYNNTGKLTVTYALLGGLCDGDLGHQILQPINANGTSVFNSKSTSPAKFRVCDANGVSIGTPGVVQSFALVQIVNGTATDAVNEAVDSTTPDAVFRWDPTAQQWIFNISNKGLSGPNRTYGFVITLNDGTSIPFSYGLK